MGKSTVAVVFGGRSTEHDVSIVTAIAGVLGPLKLSDDYQGVPLYVSKSGTWYSEAELGDIGFFNHGDVAQKLKSFKPVQLLFEDGLTLVRPGLRDQRTKIDIVFPATHGTNGEDGSLMGFCQMANVPYVGANLGVSAISMDKLASRRVARDGGVDVPEFVGFSAGDYAAEAGAVLKRIARLKYPLFVKPTHLGSSIAVTQVKDQTELKNAIELVFHYDDWAIVEEAVTNLAEVTVPILGNDSYEVGMVEEYLYKPGEFFDFDSKYLKGGKGKKGGGKTGQGGGRYSRMPAKLPAKLYKACEDTTRRVFHLVGGSGYARIDLLVDTKAEKVYFNEINPMPGSLQNHNWRQAGLSPVQLVEKLVKLGFDRQSAQAKRTTTFDSSFLRQF